MKHFALSGFKGASVRDIAKSAELAPNMINHHFGGKQALFDSIIEQFSTDVMSVPLRVISEPAGSKAEFEFKFRMFVTEAFEIMIAHRQVFQIVSRENNVVLPLKEFRKGFTQFVCLAMHDGHVRAEIATEMVVGLVLDRLGNQVLYSASLADDHPENVATNKARRAYWLKANIDLFLHGLV